MKVQLIVLIVIGVLVVGGVIYAFSSGGGEDLRGLDEEDYVERYNEICEDNVYEDIRDDLRERIEEAILEGGNPDNLVRMEEQVDLCYSTGGCWTDCGSGCGPLRKDGEAREICLTVCSLHCVCPIERIYWDDVFGCVD